MALEELNRSQFVGLGRDQQFFRILNALDQANPMTGVKFENLNDSQKLYEFYKSLIGVDGGLIFGGGLSQAHGNLVSLPGAVFGDFPNTLTIKPSHWNVDRPISIGLSVDYMFTQHPASVDVQLDFGVGNHLGFLSPNTTDFGGVPSEFVPITIGASLVLTPISGIGTNNLSARLTGSVIMTGTANFNPPRIFSVNDTISFIDSTVDTVVVVKNINESGTTAEDFARMFHFFCK